MSGPQPLREDNHPNDYRYWGNREYFKNSATTWVKLWVSWYDLQQAYAQTSRDNSWNNLTQSGTGSAYLRRLDGQVRAANDDGVKVIVTIYQAFPTWASGATGQDPLSSKGPERKLPSNLSTNGPWAWFVGYLSARYNGAYNSSGPHKPGNRESSSAYYGNPSRAKANAIEIVNEPNTLYWPMDNIVGSTATMMRTAATVSSQWGRQTILAPATGDSPDPGAARAGVSMDWKTFTSQLLDVLAGWVPPVPVYWSQHNYKDVKYEDPALTSRAKQTIDLLYAKNWKGRGGDRNLWLTEGGYNLGSSWADPAARDAQATKIQRSVAAMRTLPQVVLWTQHGINDIPSNSFKSGLRDDFDYALPGPGAARPAWSAWLLL
ncbi:MAG TPA: hypothetical protein VH300_07000 [Thermoleophilaceae bacterium]|nr:hypothetical protein [Thermoleophilaceae bacterium]